MIAEIRTGMGDEGRSPAAYYALRGYFKGQPGPLQETIQEYLKTAKIPRPDLYLIPRSEAKINSEVENLAAFESLIRLFDARGQFEKTMVDYPHRGELRLTLEDMDIAYQLDRAERSVQGLFTSILYKKHGTLSRFGMKCMEARLNPELIDHNIHHHERVLLNLLANVANNDELRTMPGVRENIDVAVMYALGHDLYQDLMLLHNIDLRKQGLKEIDAKKSHTFNASIMFAMLYKRFAVQRRISEEQAFEITSKFAYIQGDHDTKDIYKTAIRSQAPIPLEAVNDSGALLTLYHSGEVDRAAISWKQQLELAAYEMGNEITIIRDESGEITHISIGLLPELEDEYQSELIALYESESPMLPNVLNNSQERAALIAIGDAVSEADGDDYLSYADLSVFRKLLNQKASNRSVFPGDIQKVRAYVEELRNRRQEEHPESETDLELLLYIATKGEANIDHKKYPGVESDTIRHLWEVLRPKRMDTHFHRLKNQHNDFMSIFALRDIGRAVMSGDVKQTRAILERNLYQIGKQMLLETGMTVEQLQQVQRLYNTKPMFIRFVKERLTNTDPELAEIYGEINMQMPNLFTNLSKKPLSRDVTSDGDQNHKQPITISGEQVQASKFELEIYDEDQMLLFEELIYDTLILLQERYGISDAEVRMYERWVRDGIPSPLTPAKSYYRARPHTDVTYYVEPNPDAHALFMNWGKKKKKKHG